MTPRVGPVARGAYKPLSAFLISTSLHPAANIYNPNVKFNFNKNTKLNGNVGAKQGFFRIKAKNAEWQIKNKVAHRLKLIRSKLGLTQREFAKRLKISGPTLSKVRESKPALAFKKIYGGYTIKRILHYTILYYIVLCCTFFWYCYTPPTVC